MKWTDNQLQAIETQNKNILVAAAAGSGKTAVLVERIIQKIIKQNVDIDKLLVVTFTNAAASEIRQRVLDAIYKKLEEEPDNENLQKQIILLNKSNISTIHSFCLNVIKNNFFEIGISPDFRIGDTSELELLKLEVLDEVFEELYEENNQNFIKLTEVYTGYRGDDKLKEIVLAIYEFIQSSPFPKEWLDENVKKFDLSHGLDKDFKETEWGKIILEYIEENIERNIRELKIVLNDLKQDEDLKKYYDTVLLDLDEYERGLKSLSSWDLAYNVLTSVDFKRWPTDKKIESDIKDKAQKIRKDINGAFKELVKKLMVTDSENANKDILEMYNVLVYLKEVIFKFMDAFKNRKQLKNIIDFNDIEHYALQILVKKDEETGEYLPTEVAKSYRNKFEEIAIDEYQDSNSVQEYILSTISNGHNMFMVGDVKQSIYRFRQARPELFLEKYNKFKLKDEYFDGANCADPNLKIQLFNNFRSRELVLDFANLVFKNIMTKKLGNIDYTREEYLNFTGIFETPESSVTDFAGKMSLEIIDTKDIEYISDDEADGAESDAGADYGSSYGASSFGDSDSDDEFEGSSFDKGKMIEDIQENLEKIELEARYVAFRIKEIIDSKYNIWDKELNIYRPATYKDFVILLRSSSSVAPIFEKEIFKLNMPVFSDASQKYLESIEIETILNLLKIIDNPMQDISLVSVLRSYIGGFDDNELLEIRLGNIKSSFYESMWAFVESDGADCSKVENKAVASNEVDSDCCKKDKNAQLQVKVNEFLNKLKTWQETVKYMALDEFIWKLYIETGYYNYVSMMNDGALKVANLKMLFERAKQYELASFKGLYNFIKFIDKLKKNEGEMENAKLIGENDNVIRIMSIHKSKGLEFPIVFLSTTGKKFNLRDLNENILLHQDLGIGPKYINYERKIEYSTLAKEALKIRLKNDSLSEEMRVLYVALTRPKERLIVTGVMKDVEAALEKKRLLLAVSNEENINSLLVKKYTSYLEWLQLAYLNDISNMEQCIDLKVLDLNDIVTRYKDFDVDGTASGENNDLKEFLKSYDFSENEYEKIEKLLLFKYYKQALTKVQSKVSVTSLKEMLKTDDDDFVADGDGTESKIVLDKPKFMITESKFSKAEIGTLTHLMFQKIDFKKEYTRESLEKEFDGYVAKEILSEEQRAVIDVDKIYKFIKSDFADRIRMAKAVYSEAPFYMNVGVNEVLQRNLTEVEQSTFNENILVQGIIDLYFEESDGQLVLVDYKTDFIRNGEESILVDRHKEQLLLYKKALEAATNKKVKEIYLYSTCLNKEIYLFL